MTNRKKQLEERIQKTRAAAHNRVVKDGTVQFRLDADNMEKILKLSDERRTGSGVLARMWVLERLKQEIGEVTSPVPELSELMLRLMPVVGSGNGMLLELLKNDVVGREKILKIAEEQCKAVCELRAAMVEQQQLLDKTITEQRQLLIGIQDMKNTKKSA